MPAQSGLQALPDHFQFGVSAADGQLETSRGQAEPDLLQGSGHVLCRACKLFDADVLCSVVWQEQLHIKARPYCRKPFMGVTR